MIGGLMELALVVFIGFLCIAYCCLVGLFARFDVRRDAFLFFFAFRQLFT